MPSLKKTKAYPAGAFYFPIVDKLIESDLTDVEEIEKQIAGKLKMQGIVLKDINIIKAIDADIENEGSVIDVRVKDEDIKSENALSEEEFTALLDHVMELVKDMSKEILAGNISIHPYSDKQKAQCSYCEYSSMCKFDTLFEGNTHKTVKALKDKEVKELLMKKEGS
jgi:ATP-dependent helicase/nuclease subunit B